MKNEESTRGRSVSRRRLLKALGTGIAAVGAGRSSARWPAPSRRAARGGGQGSMTLATWGGRYSKAMKDFFLVSFSQETGVTAQTVDAPGGFVPMLQAQAKAGNVTWDLVDVGEADSLFLLDNGLVQPLPADVKADLIAAVGPQHVTDHGISFAAFGWVIAANRKTAKRSLRRPRNSSTSRMSRGAGRMYREDQLTGVLYALQADGVAPEPALPARPRPRVPEARSRSRSTWPSGGRTGDQSQQVFRDQEVDMGLLWDGRAAGRESTRASTWRSPSRERPSRAISSWCRRMLRTQAAAFEFLRWYATHPVEGGKWIREMGYGVANPEGLRATCRRRSPSDRPSYPPKPSPRVLLVDVRWSEPASHRPRQTLDSSG